MRAGPSDALLEVVADVAGKAIADDLSELLAHPGLGASSVARELIEKLEATGIGKEEILEALSVQARASMQDSLERCGAEAGLFEETADALLTSRPTDPRGSLLALATFLCGVARLSNPRRAAQDIVVRQSLASTGMGEEQSRGESPCPRSSRPSRPDSSPARLLALELCQERGGSARAGELVLLDKPVTILGRGRDPGISRITDEPTVSRVHLLIRHADGLWLAHGLGSKNGSAILRRDGRSEIIETARCARARIDRELTLESGDILCLGPRARLRVLRIA